MYQCGQQHPSAGRMGPNLHHCLYKPAVASVTTFPPSSLSHKTAQDGQVTSIMDNSQPFFENVQHGHGTYHGQKLFYLSHIPRSSPHGLNSSSKLPLVHDFMGSSSAIRESSFVHGR